MLAQIKQTMKNWQSRGYSKSTLKAYEIHLRHYYSYLHHAGLKWDAITPAQLREYIIAARNAGDAPATLNARLSAIKSFYEVQQIEPTLQTQTLNIVSPVLRTHYAKPQQSQRTAKTPPLTPEQKQIILGYMAERPEHIYMAFLLLFASGLRVSEAANLYRADLSIINDRLTVHVTSSKQGNDRRVPVFENPAKLYSYALTQDPLQPLFKVTSRTLQYHAQSAAQKTGIPFSVHQTRHTFATERLRAGVPVTHLQKILGHKDISTTMMYARLLDTDVIQLADPMWVT